MQIFRNLPTALLTMNTLADRSLPDDCHSHSFRGSGTSRSLPSPVVFRGE